VPAGSVPRGNQTEFKGGAPGGPPLATNHDDKAKAVEYLLQYELGVLLKAGRLEDLMKVKEFIHFGLISQGPSFFSSELSCFRFN
jgi:hypothetical protein